MKLISWNVNGLRAVMRKMDFLSYLKEEDADIICLQETKIQDGQVDLQPEGYHVYWNYAVKKGYSGTAVFSKQEPLQVIYGIGVEEHDQEGRVITLEFENVFVMTVYTPNSRRGLERIDYRMQWEEALLSYILELDQKKPVILCGDLNVAHQEIDLKNPKANRNNAGFSDQER
ncbi:exodeoxyribonuclease III, partial [Bacillus sp. AGSP2]